MIHFATYLGSHVIGRIAEQGLANSVGLATLRHGTNPLSFVSIRLFGADPTWGGSRVGGDHGAGFDYQNVGRFYFAKDKWNESLIYNGFLVRTIPKSYQLLSTCNFLNVCYIRDEIAFPISFCVTSLTPSLKFRFDQREVDRMPIDSTMNGFACSTNLSVSPLKIGLLGTLTQAVSLRTFSRMFENPIRVLTGVTQMSLCAVAVYFLAVNYSAFLVAHKVSIVAGAALAII